MSVDKRIGVCYTKGSKWNLLAIRTSGGIWSAGRNVPEAKVFEVIKTDVRMTGYCAECRLVKE